MGKQPYIDVQNIQDSVAKKEVVELIRKEIKEINKDEVIKKIICKYETVKDNNCFSDIVIIGNNFSLECSSFDDARAKIEIINNAWTTSAFSDEDRIIIKIGGECQIKSGNNNCFFKNIDVAIAVFSSHLKSNNSHVVTEKDSDEIKFVTKEETVICNTNENNELITNSIINKTEDRITHCKENIDPHPLSPIFFVADITPIIIDEDKIIANTSITVFTKNENDENFKNAKPTIIAQGTVNSSTFSCFPHSVATFDLFRTYIRKVVLDGDLSKIGLIPFNTTFGNKSYIDLLKMVASLTMPPEKDKVEKNLEENKDEEYNVDKGKKDKYDADPAAIADGDIDNDSGESESEEDGKGETGNTVSDEDASKDQEEKEENSDEMAEDKVDSAENEETSTDTDEADTNESEDNDEQTSDVRGIDEDTARQFDNESPEIDSNDSSSDDLTDSIVENAEEFDTDGSLDLADNGLETDKENDNDNNEDQTSNDSNQDAEEPNEDNSFDVGDIDIDAMSEDGDGQTDEVDIDNPVDAETSPDNETDPDNTEPVIADAVAEAIGDDNQDYDYDTVDAGEAYTDA